MPSAATDSSFRTLLDRSPEAVLVHRHGKVVYANRAMAAMLKHGSASDLVACNVSDLLPEGAPPEAQKTTETIVFDGAPAEVIFFRDVSAEDRALAGMRRAQENLRTIIERSPYAMCICRSDRMIYVNPVMIEYLGYDGETPLLGPTLPELSDEVIHPDDRARTRDAFRALFVGLGEGAAKPVEAVKIADIHVRRKSDGVVRSCDMHGVMVMHDGSPALVTYLEDLTERRAAEARMRLADRMSSLGTLAAGVAHEINNPLAYVVANVDMVARAMSTGREKEIDVGRSIQDARTGLERIRRIVHGLKAFSRSDEDTIAPVDIIRVIESCIEMAQSHLRHRCKLVCNYSAVPLVRGNEARLAQVFLNLLVNAAQAVDESTRERNVVEVTVTFAVDRVKVAVSDNGAGISPEHLPRIFDPFFTTKPIGTGTGLGLSVCHGIVTALGGEITVESAPGRGTTARVELPIAEGMTAARTKEQKGRVRRARLLMIDDEALLLDVMSRVLRNDHDVITASDGHEALLRIADGPPFDFIFCDLMMPGMTGMDLFARITESHPDLAGRIVFVTGGAVTPAAIRFLEGTSNGVIEKPFVADDILQFVRERM